MRLYDIIKDTDAHIEGMLINEKDGVFNVLWDNDVIGIVDETDESLVVVKHSNTQVFLVEDVLHSGNKGEKYAPKEGEKYDNRRGKILLLNKDNLKKGVGTLRLPLFDKNFFDKIQKDRTCLLLYTTDYESLYGKKGSIMLRTKNSIYKLKRLKDVKHIADN